MLVLPAGKFRAQAIVSVTDPASPLALYLPKAAAEMAVSKPVMQRAAESLIETGVQAPTPKFFEQLALVAHLDGAKATGKSARVAETLMQNAFAQPGALPGSLEISVEHDDPEQAARMASAAADALIEEQNDALARTRRSRDAEIAGAVERLRGDAAAARRRLAALGGVEMDPAQVRAGAAAQTASAKAKLETIRAILASGSPPLSDRRDVPAAIETQQASYLELSRQLAKACETLGDRHTTIISLQAEVKHAAAGLTAEWRRLSKLAEGELAAARDREASLRKADDADANRRATLDAARLAVQAADDAVAHARTSAADNATEERAYRLLLRPIVPSTPVGLSPLLRLLAAGLVGALTFLLTRMAQTLAFASPLSRAADAAAVGVKEGAAATPAEKQTDAVLQHAPVMTKRSSARSRREPKPDEIQDQELAQTMLDLLPELEAIVPAFGPVPTIMIAANEAGVDTTHVALALGRAIAAHGSRALLIEADRPQPALSAAAGEDDPILIDLFGSLRVALRADTDAGTLYLAPSLRQGPRIAAALARGHETPIVDDLGAEFDIVIVDGGQAASCAAEGWGADVFLRVGRSESQRDDVRFADAFDIPQDMVIGTIVSSMLQLASSRATAPMQPGSMRQTVKVAARGPLRARQAPKTTTSARRRVVRR